MFDGAFGLAPGASLPSRLERLETFDLAAAIGQVMTTVRPLAEKNGNTLEICCAEDLGGMHADMTN